MIHRNLSPKIWSRWVGQTTKIKMNLINMHCQVPRTLQLFFLNVGLLLLPACRVLTSTSLMNLPYSFRPQGSSQGGSHSLKPLQINLWFSVLPFLPTRCGRVVDYSYRTTKSQPLHMQYYAHCHILFFLNVGLILLPLCCVLTCVLKLVDGLAI